MWNIFPMLIGHLYIPFGLCLLKHFIHFKLFFFCSCNFGALRSHYSVRYKPSLWFTCMHSLAIRKVKWAQGGLVLNSALHSTPRSKVSPSSNLLVFTWVVDFRFMSSHGLIYRNQWGSLMKFRDCHPLLTLQSQTSPAMAHSCCTWTYP